MNTSGSRNKVLKQLEDFNRSQVLSFGSNEDFTNLPNVKTPLEQKQKSLNQNPIDITD